METEPGAAASTADRLQETQGPEEPEDTGNSTGAGTGNGNGTGIRTTRVPKYYRLKRHLLDITQTMPPGAPVPPERTLATEFDTSRTTVREASLLGTDVGLPMLLLSRHSLDSTGEPVEWVRSVYRGDRYKFVARLQRPSV
jgi:GntR family transcriptional regulator